ncbi:MAG: Gfo/Idh/MocA family oxidoreductase [Roseiflexaceae bacterium]|nr:Gfo/Idh/MocA family oxidoreductase [Roseiflexaceae bacterium]
MLTNRLLPLHPLDDLSQPMLVASWQGQRLPLALMRSVGDGRAACLSLNHFDEPLVAQIVYRLLRELARREEPAALGVAVLGYGPSDAVGYRHGLAIEAVPGLAFRAACDLSEQRLEQATHDFPTLRTTTRRQDLIDAADIDIVIIATPPNLHAALAIELLQAGKHVVCEKPLCLNPAEVDAMRAAAAASGRLLTTHQNRRWDADFLAIQAALRSGLIGEAFHLESFVGGFFHPCDYWHSHAPISGGALYDWGAHYVDSILQLLPGPIASVTSVAHKRVWHDVTNADQERVQIRFADGREAEFIYSEIAAIRKPKWYVVGTEGAIVGHWNDIRLREPHRTAFYTEQEVPVTEAPPLLTLCRRTPSGALVEQQLPQVEVRAHPFHRNLADHLLTGEPLAVPFEQSARVVAVLAAAARSAAHGGSIEVVEA